MLLFGVISNVNAQQTLLKGGDSFETAVKLEPGNYQGGSLEAKEKEYFYVEGIKPGQEIKIKGTFTAGSTTYGANPILYLLNEDREELTGEMGLSYDTPEVIIASWLPDSNKDTYKYYIKTGSDYGSLASHSLEILVTDYFDANSQTDAADTFEKAMSISHGEHKGYLFSESYKGDTKDFYKIEVEKEKRLMVEITPPSERGVWCEIYDENRKLIGEKYPPNPGAIVKATADIVSAGDVFIKIGIDEGWYGLVSYAFNITTEQLPPEEEEEEEEGITPSDEETIPPEEELFEEGPNWTLISTIIGIIVAIGIVIYFLSRRKLLP